MRKRNIEKTLYLSEKEYEMLNKKCQELGLTKSEYIRQLVNNYQPTKPNVEILEKHKDGLDKIGNSLNYLIRRAYYDGYLDEASVNRQLEHLDYIIDDIKYNLKNL